MFLWYQRRRRDFHHPTSEFEPARVGQTHLILSQAPYLIRITPALLTTKFIYFVSMIIIGQTRLILVWFFARFGHFFLFLRESILYMHLLEFYGEIAGKEQWAHPDSNRGSPRY